jgi:dipeptidyl aminopeptidase/acylaminoacyl peptidase
MMHMAQPKIAPYGSWKSPITSDLIVSETVALGQVERDGDDIYWGEGRPAEGGRVVVVRRTPDGKTADITPAGFNVRSRVHEYGGGAFLVADGTVYFSNFDDNRLYRQDPGAAPRPITPEGALRYADMELDQRRGRLICVREDHREAGREAINTLVSVDLNGNRESQVLISGNDFYSTPRLSRDGTRLCWLTWNHPNLPWDGTELWVAPIEEDGTVGAGELVAGGAEESIFQPTWSPGGVLHFVAEPTGWWNLYRWRDRRIEPLHEMQAEFGLPQWVFGLATFDFAAPEQIVCTYHAEGVTHLALLDSATGAFEPIETPYSSISSPRVAPGRVAFVGGSPSEPLSVVQLDLVTRRVEVLRRSSNVALDPAYLSTPQPIEFPTENGLTAHAFFYPPRNPDQIGPANQRPPLVVHVHGGPTGATTDELSLGVQYFTSRGIAVLDVNYGGSTGYGRAYRQRLNGQWGVVDVDDCVNGARYLVQRGEVDGRRLAIEGGSAGGYTTLCALTFRDDFKAGASYFGIGDLEVFAGDTHKFESRYLDRLVGPYPEQKDRYHERSPIHFTNQLECPVILFQGLDDKVVPPNQAELMVEELRAKGLPVAYVAFEGEGHGFRRAATIKRTLEAELYFYSRIFNFELADPVEPVEIENL